MKTHDSKIKPLYTPFRKQRAAVVPHVVSTARNARDKIRQILRGPRLQAKLTIGAPNDVHEQEADRVANEVMRMPEPRLHMAPACNTGACFPAAKETLQPKSLSDQITPLVQRQIEEEEEEELIQTKVIDGTTNYSLQGQPEEEEEELLQTKEVVGHIPQVTPHVASKIASMQGGGQPLPTLERAFFETRFGCDFSQVRIHTGAEAAESARGVYARAFTVGRDVVFGAGAYQPKTASGQRLVAHELTHVVQQQETTPTPQRRPAKDALSRLPTTSFTGQFTVDPMDELGNMQVNQMTNSQIQRQQAFADAKKLSSPVSVPRQVLAALSAVSHRHSGRAAVRRTLRRPSTGGKKPMQVEAIPGIVERVRNRASADVILRKVKTTSQEVLDAFNALCSAGNFSFITDAQGNQAIGGSACNGMRGPTGAQGHKHTCECFCAAVNDQDVYKINVSTAKINYDYTWLDRNLLPSSVPFPTIAPASKPETKEAPSTTTAGPPNTVFTGDWVITLPSPSSPFTIGVFDPTGKAVPASFERLLAHELCGHARRIQTGPQDKGDRKSHDSAIRAENDIAKEQGWPARGLYGDPNQGESYHQASGDLKLVYKLKDGWHYQFLIPQNTQPPKASVIFNQEWTSEEVGLIYATVLNEKSIPHPIPWLQEAFDLYMDNESFEEVAYYTVLNLTGITLEEMARLPQGQKLLRAIQYAMKTGGITNAESILISKVNQVLAPNSIQNRPRKGSFAPANP